MSTAGEGRAENPMRSTPYLKEKADTARQFTFSTHREVQAAPIMPHKELGTTAVGSDTGWIFLIVTILAVLIGAVRFRTVAFFTSLSMAFTSDIYWRTLNNSLNMQFYWTSRFAFILAQAIVTVLIYELVLSTGVTELWGLSHFALFCLIAVAYIVYQLLKLALDRTIGFAFDCSNDMAQILQGKLLTGTLFGLTVLPVVIVFPFVGERFYILLAIIALILLITTYVVGTLKSLKTISIDGISLFYGILYLCGVEITPLLFIVRALQIG